MTDYLRRLQHLYGTLASVTKPTVIVDSSKSPSHGYFLSVLPDIDLRVVHLTRDSRAVAYSWARRKKTELGNMSLPRSVDNWIRWNHLASSILAVKATRYVRIKYEDLVDSPQQALSQIISITEEKQTGPVVISQSANLTATHQLGGNPNRFKVGNVTLEPDAEWKQKMSLADKILVTAFTAPWLMRYGYSLRF